MKKLIILLLLPSLLIGQEADLDATLEETISFIEGKYSGGVRIEKQELWEFWKHHKIEINECSCKISGEAVLGEKSESDNRIWSDDSSFSFSDLATEVEIKNYKNWETKNNEPVYYINLNTFNGEKKIRKLKNGFSDEYQFANKITIMPNNPDKKLLERMKKAIKHIITLCGGKEEKF